MIANINTVALQGISTVNVNAQIHMANGIPALILLDCQIKLLRNPKNASEQR